MTDRFPAADFDAWADTYDSTVTGQTVFPFYGFTRVLDAVLTMAEVQPGMNVLDLGTGTGLLAERFAAIGCYLWCTDYSNAMLAKARLRLPEAVLVLHDLRQSWPVELSQRFERIVSGYVFHHFEAPVKVRIVTDLVQNRLKPGGRLVIGDISFTDRQHYATVQQSAAEEWEEEEYWTADEMLPLLRDAGLQVQYVQVSDCAGIYLFEREN